MDALVLCGAPLLTACFPRKIMFDFSTKSCGCYANQAAEAQRSFNEKKKKEKHTENILDCV